VKYTFQCSQGHDPETMEVEAMNDDEAMEKLLPMAKEHLAAKHSEMASMSDEDVKNMIMGGWKKEEASGETGVM